VILRGIRANPVLFFLSVLLLPLTVSAQIDPEYRRLFQVGYNQPLQGKAPIAGYGFFYYNRPEFFRTNLTLRLAVAPVYFDGELGFSSLLGPHTDVGLGMAGGGFAETYSEIRQGKFIEGESFIGHGAELSSSVYHLFNPDQNVPLSLVLRGGLEYYAYESDNDTDPNFEVPDNRATIYVRTGLRWGGQEPSLTEPLAMEISLWEESRFRSSPQAYGFDGDREIEADSHLFWGRALMRYTFESEHLIELTLTAGTSVDADRFSAYRLGGVLPFVAEFPLNIPGYYYQELSAERFALLNGQYSFPVTPEKNWRLTFYGGAGPVETLPGLEQPDRWQSGAGGGLTYISPTGTWITTVFYAHGFTAIRSEGRGASQIGVMLQLDLEAKRRGKVRFFTPGVNPYGSRGGTRLLGR